MPIGEEPLTEESDDSVRIRIHTGDVQIVERYSFHSSILQQPAAFAVQLSGGRGVAETLRRCLPGMTCSLSIGKYRQFTGEIDAPNASGDASRTTINLTGRDLMARLHDQDIEAERSFDHASYSDLVNAALEDVELGQKIVEISNTANRNVRAGVGVKIKKESVQKGEPAKFNSVVTAKMGESWLTFLERHFAKIGLFLWCDAYGNFVLSRPNADQEPAFHFYRTTKNSRRIANVESWALTNDTTNRFTEVIFFARNHGRKAGHNHTNGEFVDEEMRDLLKYTRRRVSRDMNVNSTEEAEFYARRKIAEVNRAGWKLQYTISGHSAPTLISSADRAIVAPDMIARVDDDDLDIHDELYIESVEHRSPPRQTVITMMRIQDLLFGEFQAEAGKAKAKAKVKERKQIVRADKDIEGRDRGLGLSLSDAVTDYSVFGYKGDQK